MTMLHLLAFASVLTHTVKTFVGGREIRDLHVFRHVPSSADKCEINVV